MRDRDVRQALLDRLQQEHGADDNTVVVQEMGVWSGTVRIDVAVVNGELTGFELKSERDTLQRLPAQAEVYGLVFDRIYIVTTERHLQKAKAIVPDWWGTLVIREQIDGSFKLKERRKGRLNPSPDPVIIAKLLWKDEALELLGRHGLAKGYRSKSASTIHNRLATELSLDELRDGVRLALKRRAMSGQVHAHALNVPIYPDSHPLLQVPG